MKIFVRFLIIVLSCSCASACFSNDKSISQPKEQNQNSPAPLKPITITLPEINFTSPKNIDRGNYSFTIINRFIDLLNATPAKDSVFFSMFMFSYTPAIDAIKDADARGVKMFVLLDSSRSESISSCKEAYPAMRNLKNAVYRSVINNLGNGNSNAINHNKFAIFSSIVSTNRGILKNVVFQTSNNFTQTQCSYFQDNIVLSDSALFNAYRETWWDIYTHAKATMEGYQYKEYSNDDASLKAYFFPKIKNGKYFAPDPVVQLLQQITSPSTAQIRILMATWTNGRSEIVESLNTLLKNGAKVKLILSEDAAKSLSDNLNTLKTNGAEVRVFDYVSGSFKKSVHSKYLLIDGQVNGQQAEIVATGSENYTGAALKTNNETLLQFNDADIFLHYISNFEQINSL